MASSSHNPVILFKRVLSLTESSPLILCLDSMAQTSHRLIQEFIHQSKSKGNECPVVYISFETVNVPSYCTQFIDAAQMDFVHVVRQIISYLPAATATQAKKHMVIIDSLNYIPTDLITRFLSEIASPHCTIIATYHKDITDDDHAVIPGGNNNYPDKLTLLQFMATTILDIEVALAGNLDTEEVGELLNEFRIPRGLNNEIYQLRFVNKRKSGRSLEYDFKINSKNHEYELSLNTRQEEVDGGNELETPDMLQGLTTFNLGTSNKQKLAKDQVALPFLEAQSFGQGGAIVYEYEKDDDYDEEDPYEDPF
ncbi:Iki1p [Saccharomyces cerevisiae x Saccharomyces kudriavzevii VIN7]|uniref:Elongator complex protein 5 n=1 Tax=Saccharomyces cerevisiae x Saccharomyces kudriavzevii (strain VIN7) TaxID=1095631 RepID=H0GW09_SACCK|nr:Iki1p [Saccharomyces cerevisiae x Saccharomyces kudriavzevii VIN7]